MDFSLFHPPQNYETAQSISPIRILCITICIVCSKGPPSRLYIKNLHKITATLCFYPFSFASLLFFLVMKLIFCCFYVVLCYVRSVVVLFPSLLGTFLSLTNHLKRVQRKRMQAKHCAVYCGASVSCTAHTAYSTKNDDGAYNEERKGRSANKYINIVRQVCFSRMQARYNPRQQTSHCAVV